LSDSPSSQRKRQKARGLPKGNSAKVAEHTQSTNKGDHPATNTSPTFSNPTISKQNNVEPALHDDHTQASGNETTKQDLKIQRQLSLFINTGLLVVVGVLQFVALIVQAIVFYRTLKKIGKQAGIMETHADYLKCLAAGNNAVAAKLNAMLSSTPSDLGL